MSQSRRVFLATGVAAAALPNVLSASNDVISLNWSDLVPDTGGVDMDRLRMMGVVQHGEMTTPLDQELGGKVTDEFNDQTVRMPGYLLPLDFEGMAMTTGLLVPYVGACIHVPPPPPNQLVFLTTETPYELQGLFEPVWVTGTFGIASTET
ncbi:MAG: DUF3299 domain-containing protein, partial [Rhodobacteraceae bacterium]|nr:DUF3299 domain-containing protein [Paracoccaceae bacterium]